MWHNAIGRRIRRDNRWLQLWGLLACWLAFGLLFWLRFSLYSFFAGPFAVSHADLFAIKNPAAVRSFVTFDTPKPQRLRTGIVVQSSKSPEPYAEYVLVPIQDRLLPVRSAYKYEGETFTGHIRSLTSEEEDKLRALLDRDAPNLKSHLLPYVVDAQSGRFRPDILVGLGLVLLFGSLGVYWTVRGLKRMYRPELHPLARALERFGTPCEVADRIDQERAARRRLRLGAVELIGRWLVCGSLLRGYKVFRLDDLVWVYKMIFRSNGLRSYLVLLFDRLGESFQVPGRELRVDGVIAVLAALAPWLIAGYDQRLEDLWKNDPAALIEAVQQRRQEFLQPPSEDSSPVELTQEYLEPDEPEQQPPG